MFVILAGIAKKSNASADGEGIEKFSDALLVADYAKDSINTLAKLGVINGDSNGCVNPQMAATRAEAAKVIYDILVLINNL